MCEKMNSVRKLISQFNYREAFKRNLGIITNEEQDKLRNATVGIPGMGGVGGLHLITLARMGIGGFHIADLDTFEIANMNRQYGAFVSTAGRSKTEVMTEKVLDINPDLRLKTWNDGITEKNLDAFLKGCDVIVDSLDAFALEIRRKMITRAQELGIPVVSAGPLGFSVAMITFTKDSLRFDDYIDYRERESFEENFLRFLLGTSPRPYYAKYMLKSEVSARDKRGPSIASAIDLCAGVAATEVLKLILKRGRVLPVPHYTYLDPFLMKYKTGYIPRGNKNLLQRLLLKFLIKHYSGEK